VLLVDHATAGFKVLLKRRATLRTRASALPLGPTLTQARVSLAASRRPVASSL
jgi:hypothetical protein